ncbi:flagellar assembly peptidoglycan hydrolase FlgJ [Marinomonas agarivorans]|nr:flagellar assembly peptidoglycan hydrolase FlgJ [Marinomonas agarivorans]
MNKINSNDFFADFNALAKLKAKAQTDPDGALKKVAQEFESIFINMMLKNMRASNDAIGSDLFSSNESKQYREMLDSQMAQSLSKSGGIGISEALIRQLQSQSLNATAGSSQGTLSNTTSETDFLNQVATQDLARIQALARQTSSEFIAQVKDASVAPQAKMVSNSESTQNDTATVNPTPVEEASFNSPDEFVASLWPLAQEAAKKLGVDPKAILAQAALETGWGKYPIAKSDGSASFNMFGIKADSRWSGERAVVTTLEYQNGIAKQQKAPFRAYESFSESFSDYADFLTSSERYKDALLAGDNVAMFADKLQQGGYATDPQYSQKIQSIAESDWFKGLF